MLTGKSIYKSYGNVHVLRGVDIHIKKGEVVSIVGASGAGKSTLLHILGTLDKPDSGEININDTSLTTLSGKDLAKFRNKKIGFVFQFHHLLPEFTAFENILIPGWISNNNKKDLENKASELLQTLNLTHCKDKKPDEMSGGEQQRVAVARALINNPDIVFADEPSGNLDSENATNLHNLFFDLCKKYNQTFLIATHNKELADMCDRTLIIKDGVFV